MITRKEKPNSEQELKRILNPLVVKWFFSRFKEFSLPQLFGVMEIHSRSNVLVSAPTGATKSLTAFLSILNELVDSAEKGILEDKVYCVYISPLKALNSDIAVNLIQPLKEIETLAGKELGIRVAVRTGDTSSSEKQKMLKKVPHILITTPESLAICLVSPKFKNLLHDIDWAIIDEVHSIAENKRGVDLSLSLERLQHSSPAMCRVGLSATIEPLEEIAKFLVGNERPCKIIDVQFIKKLDLKVISPVNDLINVTWNELEKRTYEVLNELIQQHKTTLIFTNTRAATERVVHNLKTKFGKKYYEISEEPPYAKSSLIGAHHGSLSKDVRFAIEQQLREGKLKCVVSSTSLELGLDIGYVDLVILLDSPKSVARALQRCLTFDMRVLCEDGTYQKIGEIVENKLDIKVISYDKNKGYIANKVKIWHKNKAKKIFNIALGCGENLKCTGEHPLLTSYGWKKARELNKGDLIAEIKDKINFQNSIPYLFELMPKDKIFVINIENFFQKQIDEYLEHNKISVKSFAKIIGMPYSRLIDCRRIKGRKKSIRLDHFLKVCDICNIPMRNFLPYLQYLKTKGRKWAIFPLKPTKEIMWLAGVVATDGCIVKSKDKQTSTDYYKIKIGNKSKLLIDRVKEIISKFDIVPYVSIRDGSFYNLEFGSNLFAHLFESFGIPSKNKSFALDVNDNLYSFSPDLIYSYLGGIFEGDGNFNEAGMVRIFTASKKFALGLHFLLSRLGYSNKVSRNKIKPSKLVKKVSNGYIYCVGIYNKNDLKRFFQNIPIYAEKSKRGELFTNNYEFITRCKSEKFLSYSKIKSINVINKKVNVYNLTLEEEPNNFIVGNVIVHNCGRAGHRLHDTTKGRIVVLDRDNLVECSVLLKNAVEKKIDNIHIPKNCLDVLAQQIIGMAIEQVWDYDELLGLVKKSYNYHNLKTEDFNEVLNFLAGEYTSLEDRHVYAKIWWDKEEKKIGKRGKSLRIIYMTNLGTIPDQSGIIVKIGAQPIGQLDESFVEKLKPWDIFVLGGNTYMFKFSRGMVAQVSSAAGRTPTVPSWFSEMLPLSFDLAMDIQRFRSLVEDRLVAKESKKDIINFIHSYLYVDDPAAEAIYNYIKEQYDFAMIPSHKKILIEHYIDENDKKYSIFHTLFGRRVNDCLSRAIAHAIARKQKRAVEIGINDNCFYVTHDKDINVIDAFKLLKSDELRRVMDLALDSTEILSRRFRHCAARAFMILKRYKGHEKRVGRQQVSSMILMNAVKRISADFPILKEARREVLEDLMDIDNTINVLKMKENGTLKVKEITTRIPTPFAFNLIVRGCTDIYKAEDKQKFLQRMHSMVLARIGQKK